MKHLDTDNKFIEPRRATKAEIAVYLQDQTRNKKGDGVGRGMIVVCACGLVATKRTVDEKHRRYRTVTICEVEGCGKRLSGFDSRHLCNMHGNHTRCDKVTVVVDGAKVKLCQRIYNADKTRWVLADED